MIFSPPDPNESRGGKGARNRFRKITEDLVGIVSLYLEGGTVTHGGEGGYLIMINE